LSHRLVALLNPVPGFGGPQRAFWRAQVQAIDSYNRPIPSTIVWTRAAYTDFASLQPWFDVQTNAFLGQGGHVPTLFPMYPNNHFTVQDEYWFFNLSTGTYIHVLSNPTPIC
jgi:hypothetical protein